MEITVKKEDPHESRYNSLNKYRSMMTLDRINGTKSILIRKQNLLNLKFDFGNKCNQGKIISQHGIIIQF